MCTCLSRYMCTYSAMYVCTYFGRYRLSWWSRILSVVGGWKLSSWSLLLVCLGAFVLVCLGACVLALLITGAFVLLGTCDADDGESCQWWEDGNSPPDVCYTLTNIAPDCHHMCGLCDWIIIESISRNTATPRCSIFPKYEEDSESCKFKSINLFLHALNCAIANNKSVPY